MKPSYVGKFKKFPFNNRGDISWLGPGFGQMIAGNDFMGNPPEAKIPQLAQATLPSVDTSTQDAKDAQANQRRMMLAAGGQTNITGGNAPILGDDIKTINMAGV